MWHTTITNIKKLGVRELILFHSATGKDSIALCDILSKNFDRVLCVFMYIVKGLDYENRYIDWAKRKYSNIEFIQIPHYCLSSYLNTGYLGIKKQKTENFPLHKIDKLVRQKYNIDFSVYGSKKCDGIQRRLMLNRLTDGISYTTRKAYPLMNFKNHEVINYIQDNMLMPPFKYCNEKPSSGCDISDARFLQFIKNKYESDYYKILNTFPMCEAILYQYENKAIRNQVN
jgi:sulfate adenylyltransferase subunit 2